MSGDRAATTGGGPVGLVSAGVVQGRLALRQIGVVRLIATILCLVVGLLVAIFSWSMPLFAAAERGLFDLRVVATAPSSDQDPRVVMVVFKDETLEHTGRRSPLDRSLLAKALTNLDALGPKAIGIDILIDQTEPEDDQLVAALRGMRTPTHLGFASNATNPGDVFLFQEAFEREFHTRLAGTHSTSASVRVEMDHDGVVRHWPLHPAGEPPLLSVSMAPHAAVFDGYQGALRFRKTRFVGRPLYAEFPIDLFAQPVMASMFKRFIAGRYVLVGADISDIDRVPNPATFLTGEKPPGLKVHADLLSQMLDGVVETPIPQWLLVLSAMIVISGGAIAGLVKLRPVLNEIFLALQLLTLAALPFALQWAGFDTRLVPQFGWDVGWLIAYTATAAAAARSAPSSGCTPSPRLVSTCPAMSPQRSCATRAAWP